MVKKIFKTKKQKKKLKLRIDMPGSYKGRKRNVPKMSMTTGKWSI